MGGFSPSFVSGLQLIFLDISDSLFHIPNGFAYYYVARNICQMLRKWDHGTVYVSDCLKNVNPQHMNDSFEVKQCNHYLRADTGLLQPEVRTSTYGLCTISSSQIMGGGGGGGGTHVVQYLKRVLSVLVEWATHVCLDTTWVGSPLHSRAAVTEERLKRLGYLEPWIFEYKFRYIFSGDAWYTRKALRK